VRISPKAGAAAVLLATAMAISGCGGTVDGVATCPGCGNDTEPDFPTPRPIPSTPESSAPPTTTSSQPSPTATRPPAGGQVLPANEAGYVYIETKSGKTRCQISADNVGCESEFEDAPVLDGQKATGVEVSASGSSRWVVGNLGAMPTTTIGYATYLAVGWSIVADSTGTTFTNDSTGHGMFVSTDRVDFF
jgi:hypothetical protein